MSKKVAKLVTVSVTTRIIVENDENISDEQIMEIALPRLINNLSNNGICDHLEDIVDDPQCPFGTFEEDDTIQNVDTIINNYKKE